MPAARRSCVACSRSIPRSASSARILAGPWPFAARARMKLSVKRAAASSPDCSSASSVDAIISSGKPRAPSLRSSSRRLCSRRASRSSAARSQATGSVTSGLERRTLRLDDLDRALLRQQLGADLFLDGGRDVLVREQEVACVLLALTDPVALVAEPRARFLDDALLHAEVRSEERRVGKELRARST